MDILQYPVMHSQWTHSSTTVPSYAHLLTSRKQHRSQSPIGLQHYNDHTVPNHWPHRSTIMHNKEPPSVTKNHPIALKMLFYWLQWGTTKRSKVPLLIAKRHYNAQHTLLTDQHNCDVQYTNCRKAPESSTELLLTAKEVVPQCRAQYDLKMQGRTTMLSSAIL